MTPYIVLPKEPGLAWVLDRVSRLCVGYVVQTWNGWEAFSPDGRGGALGRVRYRADAVELVWERRP